MFSAKSRQKNKNIQPGPEKQHSYKTKKSVCRLWLPPSEFPIGKRVLVQNVSHENHENHLIFMRMTVQVTSYFHIPIVSHKDSWDWTIHPWAAQAAFDLFRDQDTDHSWSTSLWVKNHTVRPNTENDWSWNKSKQKQTNLNKSCDKTVKYIEQYSSEYCFRECAVRTWSYPTQIRIMDYKRNFLSISVRIVY